MMTGLTAVVVVMGVMGVTGETRVTGASKEGEGGGEVEVEDVTITMAGRTTNNKER